MNARQKLLSRKRDYIPPLLADFTPSMMRIIYSLALEIKVLERLVVLLAEHGVITQECSALNNEIKNAWHTFATALSDLVGRDLPRDKAC